MRTDPIQVVHTHRDADEINLARYREQFDEARDELVGFLQSLSEDLGNYSHLEQSCVAWARLHDQVHRWAQFLNGYRLRHPTHQFQDDVETYVHIVECMVETCEGLLTHSRGHADAKYFDRLLTVKPDYLSPLMRAIVEDGRSDLIARLLAALGRADGRFEAVAARVREAINAAGPRDQAQIRRQDAESASARPAQPDPARASVGDLPPYEADKQPWCGPLPAIHDVDSGVARRREVGIVLLVATKEERDAVLRRMKPHSPDDTALLRAHIDVETYYLGRFGAHPVVLTMCEAGQTGRGGSILAATEAIRLWRPRAVVMPGIAFGADPSKQKIADVLVSTQVLCYENQRVGVNRTIQRGPNAEAGLTLVNRFRNVLGWEFARPDGSRVEMRLGPVLSGEKLIDEPTFKQELLDTYPQALGGEMEGGGLYAAAARKGVEWIVVKAICDWADGKKGDSHHELAAAAAVSVVERVFSSEHVLDGLSGPKPDSALVKRGSPEESVAAPDEGRPDSR